MRKNLTDYFGDYIDMIAKEDFNDQEDGENKTLEEITNDLVCERWNNDHEKNNRLMSWDELTEVIK